MMRIVFMGTPDFAVPILEVLKQSGYDLVAVVTQPDRPSGRGHKVQISSVKEKALELGLQVVQPQKVKDEQFIKVLQDLQPELIVVAAYGQILPEEILRMPLYGCLNVHASLLPYYRGAAPIQRAIMEGAKKTGVSIMLMDKGLDTGDILTQEEIPIPIELNFGQLHDQLAFVGSQLLSKTIPLWIEGKIAPRSQSGLSSNYAYPLKKEDEKIDWTNSAEVIYNQIRGLTPAPGAYTIFKGNSLKIKEAEIYAWEGKQNPEGTVHGLVKGQGFVVQAGQGSLLIKQVQPRGKKVMTAQSYLNGYHLEVGDVFNDSE